MILQEKICKIVRRFSTMISMKEKGQLSLRGHDGFGGFDGFFGRSGEHLALLCLSCKIHSLHDGFDGFGGIFGGSGEHFALLLLVLQIQCHLTVLTVLAVSAVSWRFRS